MNKSTHEKYMQMALDQAADAGVRHEVPVGAVLVSEGGRVLSGAGNRILELNDPTAHAEILVFRQAADKLGNYRLLNTTLYVTLEPCPMCMGAMVHARISTLVYGAADPKWGAAGSLYNFGNDPRLNHFIEVIPGIREAEATSLIQDFFQKMRQ